MSEDMQQRMAQASQPTRGPGVNNVLVSENSWTGWLRRVLLVSAVTACMDEPGSSRTAADAVSLGFQRVNCDGVPDPIYADQVDVTSQRIVCQGIPRAVNALIAQLGGDIGESTFDIDSISVIVAERRGAAASDPYRMVTIELVHRPYNLYAVILGDSLEAGAVPEGLRY